MPVTFQTVIFFHNNYFWRIISTIWMILVFLIKKYCVKVFILTAKDFSSCHTQQDIFRQDLIDYRKNSICTGIRNDGY